MTDLKEESEINRRAFKGGDKLAPLLMLRDCYYMHWPVPEWALEALTAALNKVESGNAHSWDDVLGRPRPPRTHAHTAQLDHQKYAIYVRVRAIMRNEGVPISEQLFERVGREMGLGGATTIKQRYYQVDRIVRRLGRWEDDPKASILKK
jgi:hypothetical protein